MGSESERHHTQDLQSFCAGAQEGLGAMWCRGQFDSDDEFPSMIAVADTHLDSPELAAFDFTVNDWDIDACGDTEPASSQVLREVGMQMLADTIHDVDAVGDTAPASSQALREVGVHMLTGSGHQAELVHLSQPRDEEVWVEPIRSASSTPVAVQNRFAPLIEGGLHPSRGSCRGTGLRGNGFRHRDSGE